MLSRRFSYFLHYTTSRILFNGKHLPEENPSPHEGFSQRRKELFPDTEAFRRVVRIRLFSPLEKA